MASRETQSLPVEIDFLELARRRGAALFRVLADHRDGWRGWVGHYINEDREAALRQALDLAFCYRAANASVEEIDVASGEPRPVQELAA
jgi:hypothetical protein